MNWPETPLRHSWRAERGPGHMGNYVHCFPILWEPDEQEPPEPGP